MIREITLLSKIPHYIPTGTVVGISTGAAYLIEDDQGRFLFFEYYTSVYFPAAPWLGGYGETRWMCGRYPTDLVPRSCTCPQVRVQTLDGVPGTGTNRND